MKVFGEKLRELRNDKKLSAVALGEILGVSDTAIINWENNKHDIKAEQLVKVAKYFGVSTDYLLGLKDY